MIVPTPIDCIGAYSLKQQQDAPPSVRLRPLPTITYCLQYVRTVLLVHLSVLDTRTRNEVLDPFSAPAELCYTSFPSVYCRGNIEIFDCLYRDNWCVV